MHDLGSQPHLTANEEQRHDEYEDSQHDEQMGIGEEIDELRDGRIGCDGFQQAVLVYPPHRLLVACHLHPDRVFFIGRHLGNIGHHQTVAPAYGKGIDGQSVDKLGRMLKRVGLDQKIIVQGVVVSAVEGYGVLLTLGEFPGIRGARTLIVAGTQQEAKQQAKNVSHRHSSDNGYNRTQDGSGAHRPGAEREVRAIRVGGLRVSHRSQEHGAGNNGIA